jgi:hypothetical protein
VGKGGKGGKAIASTGYDNNQFGVAILKQDASQIADLRTQIAFLLQTPWAKQWRSTRIFPAAVRGDSRVQ